MPEGPEIRRAADRVAKAIVDVPLDGVEFGLPHLVQFQEELGASQVCEVTTRGKGMLTRFRCGLTVFSHNQLYGKWVVTQSPQRPSTKRSLRFAIYTPTRWALLYSASTIEVVPDEEVEQIPFIAKLGPDSLDKRTTPAKVRRRLSSSKFRRRSLSALLLDQGFVAGLGNYLRSEILFEAGVHPDRRPMDCDDAHLDALAAAILSLTRRSYRSGGITTDIALAKSLKDEGWRRAEYRHWVFRRGGQPCHRCGDTIVAGERGGRHTSHCPTCQPESRGESETKHQP